MSAGSPKDSAFNIPGGKLTIVHTDVSHRKGGTIWMIEWEAAEAA